MSKAILWFALVGLCNAFSARRCVPRVTVRRGQQFYTRKQQAATALWEAEKVAATGSITPTRPQQRPIYIGGAMSPGGVWGRATTDEFRHGCEHRSGQGIGFVPVQAQRQQETGSRAGELTSWRAQELASARMVQEVQPTPGATDFAKQTYKPATRPARMVQGVGAQPTPGTARTTRSLEQTYDFRHGTNPLGQDHQEQSLWVQGGKGLIIPNGGA